MYQYWRSSGISVFGIKSLTARVHVTRRQNAWLFRGTSKHINFNVDDARTCMLSWSLWRRRILSFLLMCSTARRATVKSINQLNNQLITQFIVNKSIKHCSIYPGYFISFARSVYINKSFNNWSEPMPAWWSKVYIYCISLSACFGLCMYQVTQRTLSLTRSCSTQLY